MKTQSHSAPAPTHCSQEPELFGAPLRHSAAIVALEFANRPGNYRECLKICHKLCAGSALEKSMPGYDGEDLCQESILAIKDATCVTESAFWGLFRRVASNKFISLLRRGNTRTKYIKASLDVDAGEYEEEKAHVADKLEFHASREIEAKREADNEVRRVIAGLRKVVVKRRLRPILEAVLLEAETGDFLTNEELGKKLGISPSNISRMKKAVRQILKQELPEHFRNLSARARARLGEQHKEPF